MQALALNALETFWTIVSYISVIVSLVALCPRLNHIDLSGCFQITNKIFDAFKSVSVHESDKKMDLILGGMFRNVIFKVFITLSSVPD